MLAGIFSFLARNPIAQGIAGAVAVVFFMKANNWNERRKGRNQGRNQAIDEINQQTGQKIDEIKNELAEVDTYFNTASAEQLRHDAATSGYNRTRD